jgi:hypothetical protein
MCIALTTYSCRDSCGIRRSSALTAFPQGPSPGIGAIMEPDRIELRPRRYAITIGAPSPIESG